MIKHNSSFIIHHSSLKRGFTLIELLVVIAIIGILSGILMANFVGIRQRARDGTRKSDLKVIQSALELYRSDQGSYPTSLTALTNCSASFGNNPGCSTIYLKKIPQDPLSTSTASIQYQICSDPAGTQYAIRACLENTSDSQRDNAPGGPGNDDVFVSPFTGCNFTANYCNRQNSVSFALQNP